MFHWLYCLYLNSCFVSELVFFFWCCWRHVRSLSAHGAPLVYSDGRLDIYKSICLIFTCCRTRRFYTFHIAVYSMCFTVIRFSLQESKFLSKRCAIVDSNQHWTFLATMGTTESNQSPFHTVTVCLDIPGSGRLIHSKERFILINKPLTACWHVCVSVRWPNLWRRGSGRSLKAGGAIFHSAGCCVSYLSQGASNFYLSRFYVTVPRFVVL